jgi:2-polyprenyl-3-methyl-5-hydroxy-6-metoxy-1,4-benzoquinol methylase
MYASYKYEPDPSHLPMYLRLVLKYLRKENINNIIDVGCGGGDFSEGIASYGYKMYGIDLNEDAIDCAKRRGVGTFALGSVYDSLTEPFNIKKFDAAICIEVIEHLYSPKQLILNVNNAIPSGSIFIVTTPYWGYLKNVLLAITNRLDRSLTTLWEGGHIKHFSRKTLTQLLIDNGFEVVGFEGAGEGWGRRIPFLWSGMLVVFRKK